MPIAKNVAIVTYPFRDPHEHAPQIRPLRLAVVLAPLVKQIFLVTGNFTATIPCENIKEINVRARVVEIVGESLFSKAIRLLSAQFTLSTAIIRLSINRATRVEAIFFFGGEALVIPAIISKLLRRKIIFVLRGSLEKEARIRMNIFSDILLFFQRINMIISDNIIVYSEALIKQWNIGRYLNKILVASYLFVDTDKFKLTKPLIERGNILGHVGRIEIIKGVSSFVQAMPMLSEEIDNINAIIIGGGEHKDEIEAHIQREHLGDIIKLTGWVSHDDIPYYLNQLKLLVLPSHSEGLPNIVLEAMACGTPVLATAVGSIIDLIKDGETGFIMEDNSPECIARNVIRALNCATLDRISQAARTYIENEHTYEAAVGKYRIILSSLE